MNNMRNKILSLLVLLLTAASGAWAQGASFDTKLLVPPSEWATDNGNLTADNMPSDFKPISETEALTWTGAPATGIAYLFYAFDGNKSYYIGYNNGSPWSDNTNWSRNYVYSGITTNSEFVVYYTAASASEVTVEPGSSANTWTFSMPGSDVVLTPQYAPVAKWDVVENVEQLPAALDGIIAGQDAAIVTAGQSAQGIVMYAVTTSAEPAPALTAFSATVPTAKDYDDATTLYVWYYIQGHDTPDGQQATDENTFNDSEICAEPIKVTVLTNKFDLTLSPAPVKNMTVTVAGQAKTPTDEGKVTGVKMESEVKLKAADGYKFRKVEVKKAMKLLTLTVGDVTIYYAEGDSWANAISRDENKDSGLFIREGNRVHHSNYGQLVDSNTEAVLPGAIINANESYRFIK